MNNVKTINDDLSLDIPLMSKGEQAARLYLGKKQQEKNDRDELKNNCSFWRWYVCAAFTVTFFNRGLIMTNYHLTPISRNSKLGAIPATTSGAPNLSPTSLPAKG